jgi:hypothetical protein
MKVVINTCYGGFGLSLEAVRLLASMGHADAAERLRKYDAKLADPSLLESIEVKWGPLAPRMYRMDRDDQLLVAVVEQLGEKANGDNAELKVINIPDDVEWEIVEHDGQEHVAEKHRCWDGSND